MRNWQTIGGGATWALVAILMVSAALQPVEVSAATAVVSLCADGASSPPTGCETVHA